MERKIRRLIVEEENERGIIERFTFETEYVDGLGTAETVLDLTWKILIMLGFEVEKKQIVLEDRYLADEKLEELN